MAGIENPPPARPDAAGAEKQSNANSANGGGPGGDDGAGIPNGSMTDDSQRPAWEWRDDPANPYNWPKWKKNVQLAMIAITAFSGSLATSIVSPAHGEFMTQFGVSSTVAFLPLSLYVLSLGLGPFLGGPLSEVAGRRVVYLIAPTLGGVFSLACGFTRSFAGLCIMRFLAGFFYAPSLAVGSGVLNEIYYPAERGLPLALFVLSPFLGPGLGPVVGVFLVDRKGWPWTQFTVVFLSVFTLIWVLSTPETYHPVLLRRRMAQLNLTPPKRPPFASRVSQFLTIGLFRPIHMILTEPIVGILGLYIACEFGTLYLFFGAFFLVFGTTYGFTLVQSGMVFLAVAFGCVLGTGLVYLCDRFLYRSKARHFPPNQIPPEHRLYSAMFGTLLLPTALLWFGWSARPEVNPAVPIVAIALFACGNVSLFISSMQYISDVYHRTNVASASAANALIRYIFGTVFPLFGLQMYRRLGTGWATSVLALIALILLPGPWLLFKYGKKVRAMSKYETASY
ncbi:major facilitator superfamily domain-containing protein [Apiospora rasikravindrae]|uniref:Major facilitator superfamily domain-containing protein n=1 Tax=Apiospora rasikravindrae TaxID=990691 RepID=A0ABR1TG00_9PEZI